MLRIKNISKPKSKEDWAKIFANAKFGHVLWDGNVPNPSNPVYAYTTAHHFVNTAKQFGMFVNNNVILDLGCGNGRFGIVFSEMPVQYKGIDPMQECIQFCQYAFNDYSNLEFKHCPLNSPDYGLSGTINPIDFKIPYNDNQFDDVIVYSVFTHLQTLPVAQNYINEIVRVLKPNGRLFSSWYRSPPDKLHNSFAGRSVYNEWDIMNMMNKFKILFTYGGHTGHYYDQWGMFAQKL